MQGIDVHRLPEEQCNKGECLACTHGITTIADWQTFRELTLTHYGVTVGDEHRPTRFQAQTDLKKHAGKRKGQKK